MIVLSDAQSICAAPHTITDPDLTHLVNQTIDAGLCDLTCVVIVEAGDGDADLEREVGVSLFTNPISGRRYGEPGFEPHWAWLQQQGGWFELIYPVADDGYAFVVWVRNGPSELAHLCRTFCEPER